MRFSAVPFPGLEDHLAAFPARADLGVADAELLREHFAQHAPEVVDVHVDVDLLGQRNSRSRGDSGDAFA